MLQEIDLHDAVLGECRLDWASGRMVLQFSTSRGTVKMVVDGVARATIPRSAPWGRSTSVNTVTGPHPMPGASPLVRVEIEMQSGDTIEIVGASVAVSSELPR